MKATIALFANLDVYNLVRKITWDAHCDFEIGLDVTRLEPHVSLKQPFEVQDFATLESYMEEFAASIASFEIHLTEMQVIPLTLGLTQLNEGTGGLVEWFHHSTKPPNIPEVRNFEPFNSLETAILWVDVEQSSELRALHQRLNSELEGQFGPTVADHDGDEYHFHMTVAIGNQPCAVYREVLESLGSPNIDLRFRPQELAMFVYADNFNLNQGYTTYKRIPVGVNNHG